jgi:hypothetical protein
LVYDAHKLERGHINAPQQRLRATEVDGLAKSAACGG